MAAFTARDMQRVQPAPADGAALSERAPSQILRELAAEPTKAAYSIVVLAGLVRAAEWAAIIASGLAPYYAYIVRQNGSQPLYYFVTLTVATLSILIFQTLHCYTTQAFRHPTGQLFRMTGAWVLVFLALFATVFFLKGDVYVSRVWIVAWFALGVATLALVRSALARFVGELARAGRLQRRAVVVGGGDLGKDLLHDLAASDPADIRVLGVFDDRGDAR